MWYGLRMSPRADPDLVRSATELLQSTTRHIILTTGGAYLLWHLVATVSWPQKLGRSAWLITPVVALTFALCLWLLPKRLLAAQAVWQIGLAATIALAIYVFRQPEIAFFYALLPLMAIVTVGWPAGLLSEGLVVALVLWLSHTSAMPSLSTTYGLGVITGGAFAGLVGWAAARPLLTVTQWSLFSFAQAQKNMEEARQHRAEAVRVLKDLDQAYHRLERANHMLVLARAEAEEAREARNRLAMAISHELRTPLNFILGFSELMVSSPDTYAEQDQWPPGLYEDIREIYRSTIHLSRLVTDVLDLGRIEALQMALIKDWVDPAQIVQEVEAMARPALARKGLYFRSEVETDLPNVFVDHTRIRQVLLNLVSNGLRFTEQGGVTVRLQKGEEALLFCVQDTGPGIAEEDIPKVFEEFRQVGSDGWRRREGAGLGIPISRRFIELHGGRMWVESRVGEGTSLHFTLPLPQAARDLPSSSSQEASDARYWRRLKEKAESERISMVLSADPAAGEIIAQYAGEYEMVVVHSPDQVGPRMAELLPSALILDHTMIQDKEVQSTIRELPYDLPVISFVLPGSPGRPRHLPAGVSSYLVKPIGRQDLIEVVQALGPGIRSLLVVDDDPAMVRFVTLALKSAEGELSSQGNCQLMTALTAAEALQRLRENKPDALLLDLALPDMSGWEVLKELQQSPDLSEVPVILITAHDWPQMLAADEREALQVLMRRPLSRRELSSVLRCLLATIRPTYPTASAGPAHPTGLSE